MNLIRTRRPISFFMIALMLWIQLGPSWAAVMQKPAGTIDPAELATQLFELGDAVSSRIDHSRFNVEALANALAGDSKAIFDTIRDRVAFEAYQGALRGPEGALEGLAGNAADQSLLLAEALSHSELSDIEIVSGRLSLDRAKQLYAQMFSREGAFHIPPQRDSIGALVQRLANNFRVPAETINFLLSEQRDVHNHLLDRLGKLAQIDAFVIADRLHADDPGVLTEPIADPEDIIEKIRQHSWVRAKTPDGRVVELDPSFASAQYGRGFASETGTTAWEAALEAAPVAHIRLELERLNGDTVETEVVWERSLPLYQLARDGLKFSVFPDNLEAAKLASGQMDVDILLQQIDQSEVFQPVVHIGGVTEGGYGFDLDGNRREISNGAALPYDAIGNVLDCLFGCPAQEKTHLAGINWSLQVGDSPALTASLYDRFAAGSRTALNNDDDKTVKRALIFSGEYSVNTYLRNRSRMLEDALAHLSAVKQHLEDPGSDEQPAGIATHTSAWLSLVESTIAQFDFNGHAVRAYYGAPQVVVYQQRFNALDAEQAIFSRSFDVASNPLTVMHNPKIKEAATAARFFKLQAGALQTLAEAWLLGGDTVANAHNSTRAALESGTPIKIYGNASSLDAAGIGPAAMAEMNKDLKRGYTLIAAGDRPRHWWRYDKLGGELLGRSDAGKGAGFVEYLTPTNLMIGTFIGIHIGWAVCAYMHGDNAAKEQQCRRDTVIADIIALIAMLIVLPIAGPYIGMSLIMGAGIALTTYGLASGNDQATNIGIGLIAEPLGAIAANEWIPAVAGPSARRFGQWLRETMGEIGEQLGNRAGPRLAHAYANTAASGGTAGGRSGFPNFLAMTGDYFDEFMESVWRLPRSMLRSKAGQPFEDFLFSVLHRSADDIGDEISPIVRAGFGDGVPGPDDVLPQMQRVIRGHYNSVHGADLFAVDNAGRLWVIEAKGSARGAGEVGLGGPVRAADNNIQMSPEWRRYAGERLANRAPDGLDRIRQLMNWQGRSDQWVRHNWEQAVEGARKAVIIPEGFQLNPNRIPRDLDPTREIFVVDY